MNKFLDKFRSFFAQLGAKLKRKTKDVPAVSEPPTKPPVEGAKGKMDRFTLISWVVTIVVVIALLGSTVIYKNSLPTTSVPATQPTSTTNTGHPQVGPVVDAEGSAELFIPRKLQLKTNIPERPRYESVIYRV